MDHLYNIYCDESCHLERDQSKVMALGALWMPHSKVRHASRAIQEIKEKHHLAPDFEVKWSKVSPRKLAFYLDLVEWFFKEEFANFRVLIVPEKDKLDHTAFGQNHDLFFHKMYYHTISILLDTTREYQIYIDIKDTHSGERFKKLHQVLSNKLYQVNHQIVRCVMPVHSKDFPLLQVADLMIGAVVYANRGLKTSSAKTEIIRLIQTRTSSCLTASTVPWERKFNLFRWQAR